MEKALIYTRVSTEEQADEGKSIETQIKICKKWAKDNGCGVTCVYKDEGKTATNLNRPGLQDLLARCKEDKEIRAVLVQDTDRLARNTLDHLTIRALLKKKNIKLVSISQPIIDDSPEGDLVDTIIAGVNAFQSKITGRKTSKVLEEKAKLGWFPGGRPPLGYKNTDNQNPTSTLDRRIVAIDEEIAPHMKKVFQMYATGNYSLDSIAEWLNNQKIKSVTGGKMRTSSLSQYLKNPFYTGKFWWNDKLYQGKHEATISKKIFDRVQQILTIRNQNASRSRKHDFLLRGFVFCADCKRRLWAEQHKKKDRRIYRMYFCHYCRPRIYMPLKSLEKKVEKIFGQIELSKEYTKSILDTARRILLETRQNTASERKLLANKKRKLENAIKETEDARFVHKTLTEENFLRIYNRYLEDLKETEEKIQNLHRDHGDKIQALEKVLRLAESIGQAYKKADPQLKRAYLGLFLKKIEVKDKKVIDYSVSDLLEPLIKAGSVRVRKTGLRKSCSIITDINIKKILKSFQNVAYIGVLRQRWEEIKRLNNFSSLAIQKI